MSRKKVIEATIYNQVETVTITIIDGITDEIKQDKINSKCLTIKELEDTQGRRFFEIEIQK